VDTAQSERKKTKINKIIVVYRVGNWGRRMSDAKKHAEAVWEAVQSSALAAQSLVAASWRRSLLQHQLTPDSKQGPRRLNDYELKQTREALGRVLSIAEPTLNRLFKSVGNTGCCVLLSDANGRIVRQNCTSSDEATFNKWGLWSGAIWDENNEGTNGIGTCIVEKSPVVIHRDQHFHARNTAMSCIDAPIYGADGKLLAVLDVSSCRADDMAGYLSLVSAAVIDAARRIESDHFRASFVGSRIVMGEEHGGKGAVLLAVDQDDLVIGATRAARQIFGLSDASFTAPRPAQDVLSGSVQASNFSEAERGEIKRALARANGNVSAAARQLGIGRATFYRRMQRLNVR